MSFEQTNGVLHPRYAKENGRPLRDDRRLTGPKP